MPFYKDVMSSGNLHIHFEVEFPKPRSLKPEQITQLKQVLKWLMDYLDPTESEIIS
jgi:DnaJ family protein A protein 2